MFGSGIHRSGRGGIFPFCRVITAEPAVGPGGRAAQSLVLHHKHVLQQVLFPAFVLQVFVGAQPDAIAIAVHFAAAFARAAARAVALVFRASGFGTEKCDFRERTIAAVLAPEQDGLADLLDNPHRFGALTGICRMPAEIRATVRQRAAGAEHEIVGPLGQMINQPDVF